MTKIKLLFQTINRKTNGNFYKRILDLIAITIALVYFFMNSLGIDTEIHPMPVVILVDSVIVAMLIVVIRFGMFVMIKIGNAIRKYVKDHMNIVKDAYKEVYLNGHDSNAQIKF